jgi:hypothetical protein
VLAAQQGPERLYYTSAAHEAGRRRDDAPRPCALHSDAPWWWSSASGSFRTVRGVLPLVAVSIALIWTIGVLVMSAT